MGKNSKPNGQKRFFSDIGNSFSLSTPGKPKAKASKSDIPCETSGMDLPRAPPEATPNGVMAGASALPNTSCAAARSMNVDDADGDKWTLVLAKLDKLDKIDMLCSKVDELTKSVEFCHDSVEDILKENKLLKEKLAKAENEILSLHAKQDTMSEQINEQQWRSMRDNLMFFGIPENTDEDCEAVVRQFIHDELQIQESATIQFARVHRVGKKESATRKGPRAIVAKFELYKQRELVKSAAKNLAGKKFGLGDQVPDEWARRRKEQLPALRAAKSAGKKAHFNRDKLIVDGKVVACQGQ